MVPYHWQYLALLMQILAALLLGVGMVTASWFIGRHRPSAVKLDAYECGIPAVGNARGKLSVRFYLVAVLFILFDVESVFLLPFAVAFTGLGVKACLAMLAFTLLLIEGLAWAWAKGVLTWE